jgi:hypothetical protein
VTADREPEAGAAIAAGGRAVGLCERGEQARLDFLRDPDAGIGHADVQPVRGGKADLHHDLAAFVNLTALASRLVNTCRKRKGSPETACGRRSSMWQASSIFLACARGAISCTTSSTA